VGITSILRPSSSAGSGTSLTATCIVSSPTVRSPANTTPLFPLPITLCRTVEPCMLPMRRLHASSSISHRGASDHATGHRRTLSTDAVVDATESSSSSRWVKTELRRQVCAEIDHSPYLSTTISCARSTYREAATHLLRNHMVSPRPGFVLGRYLGPLKGHKGANTTAARNSEHNDRPQQRATVGEIQQCEEESAPRVTRRRALRDIYRNRLRIPVRKPLQGGLGHPRQTCLPDPAAVARCGSPGLGHRVRLHRTEVVPSPPHPSTPPCGQVVRQGVTAYLKTNALLLLRAWGFEAALRQCGVPREVRLTGRCTRVRVTRDRQIRGRGSPASVIERGRSVSPCGKLTLDSRIFEYAILG